MNYEQQAKSGMTTNNEKCSTRVIFHETTNPNLNRIARKPMLRRISPIVLLFLSGCLTSTISSTDKPESSDPILFGLYEGIDTNIISGNTNSNPRAYYRFHKDGTFQYTGIQVLADSEYIITQNKNPDIKYFMFFSRKGSFSVNDSQLSFSNLYSRWSGLDSYYTLSFWEPETSFSLNIPNTYKIFTREMLVPKLTLTYSDSVVRRFKRIGDDNALIPIQYFGSNY
ncbi:MAG: hypothetical protein IPP69_16660 [Flavobacteriales bacterium]|nr:hypothetical protein [Flavobacteriales bacterium]